MDDQSGRHVVAARGEALMEVPAAGLISASYSTLVYSDLANRATAASDVSACTVFSDS